MWNILIFIIVQLNVYHDVKAQSRTNFLIKKFDFCATDSPVKYYGNITLENNNQYFDFTVLAPIPLDENIGISCFIETALSNKTFMPLFTIREKYFCRALNKYMGEFWYDMERAAQIPIGVCPISPGRYYIHHLLLDFKKITLQTFPFGTLRFTFQSVDKRNKQMVFCIILVAENLLV